jgi:hypothetical protein
VRVEGPPHLAPREGATDWRKPEHRREAFHDSYTHSLKFSLFPGCVYFLIPFLRERYEWDQEQALWFAFLNGNTQHPLTSLMLHRRGSRPEEVGGVLDFYYAHRESLGWDTDRRYHRRSFESAALGYLHALDGRTQADFWQEASEDGWQGVWRAATSIPTFGRLSAWSLCDYLHICGVDCQPDDLMLEDQAGSRSHRNGLCLIAGLDVYDWHASNPSFNGHYPKRLLEHLAAFGEELLTEARERAAGKPWARDVSYLTLESALCTYKSWHRPNRRYPGVYADMLFERIRDTQRAFPEEPLDVFWEARQAKLPRYLRLEDCPGDPGLSAVKQNHYRLTGEVPVLGREFPKYWSAFDEGVRDGLWTRVEGEAASKASSRVNGARRPRASVRTAKGAEGPEGAPGEDGCVLVCGEWPLLLKAGAGGYYHYVNKRAGEVGRNAHCIRWLLESLDLEIESVVEPFGGVGVFATVIQGVLHPTTHRLYDLDTDCLAQLRAAFEGTSGVTVEEGDAERTIGGESADLYLLDFPSPFTAMHFDRWAVQWERLIAQNPKAIIWMDGASWGMHWHAARYAQVLGRPVADSEDYARGMSDFLFDRYGYALRAATVSRGCFYFAATPGEVAEFPVQKFTTRGLALTPVLAS